MCVDDRTECPPRISVVMAVYNGEKHLRAAIDGILAQTEQDLELILVDDGSSDSTPAILAEYAAKDPRIRVLTNETNRGPACRNRGVDIARAALVAIQDADDLSSPDRLERQAAFLDAHPEVALVGTACKHVTEDGEELAVNHVPTTDGALRGELLERTPFPPASMMVRREVFLELGGYRAGLPSGEDADFLLRLTDRHKLAALDEPLYVCRLWPHQTYFRYTDTRSDYHRLVRRFAAERRATGSDGYDRYMEEGGPGALSGKKGDATWTYHRHVAALKLASGDLRGAFRHVAAAARRAPLRTPLCLAGLARAVLKKALAKAGLLSPLRRRVRGK
jgi:glycosyltransferase involved in cell wall biosynthesis